MVLEVFLDGEQGQPNAGQSDAVAGVVVVVVGPAAAADVAVGVVAAAVIVVEDVEGSWVAAGVAVAGSQGAEPCCLDDTAGEKAILQWVVGQAPRGGGAVAGWGIALEALLEGAWEL